MCVGALAGIICFCFLKIAGEPSVERAIAFETQMDAEHAKADAHMAHVHDHGHAVPDQDPEPQLVSRSVQSGPGLFTGVAVYGAAFGGLFALAFACVYGRMGSADARTTSALLAAAAFIAIYLVPGLKYPASPPSIGAAETIGARTAFYFAMICISLAAMIGAAILQKMLIVRHSQWTASMIAAGAYLCVIVVVCLLLPAFDEVPVDFPATVLWQFRIAALGAQLLMWTTIGLLFGALTERAAQGVIARAKPVLE